MNSNYKINDKDDVSNPSVIRLFHRPKISVTVGLLQALFQSLEYFIFSDAFGNHVLVTFFPPLCICSNAASLFIRSNSANCLCTIRWQQQKQIYLKCHLFRHRRKALSHILDVAHLKTFFWGICREKKFSNVQHLRCETGPFIYWAVLWSIIKYIDSEYSTANKLAHPIVRFGMTNTSDFWVSVNFTRRELVPLTRNKEIW